METITGDAGTVSTSLQDKSKKSPDTIPPPVNSMALTTAMEMETGSIRARKRNAKISIQFAPSPQGLWCLSADFQSALLVSSVNPLARIIFQLCSKNSPRGRCSLGTLHLNSQNEEPFNLHGSLATVSGKLHRPSSSTPLSTHGTPSS